MKILFVTPYFLPHIGGVENYVYNIAKGLKKQFKYEIAIVTSNYENKTYKEETLEGMKVYRLPRQFKISNTPISFKWKKQIKKIIEKEKPDVINAHSPVPFISDVTARIAHKLKIPFVLTYHAGSMKKGKSLIKNMIINFYESVILKKTLKYSDRIVCSSDFVRLNFLRNFSAKTITINPGVDIKKFKPKKNKFKNRILFIGNFTEEYKWKGLDYLIKAIKISKDLKLIVVGEGPHQKIKNIEFRGIKKGKELIKEIQNCNILVLPSISEAESFGMVLIEAMACKKPVIGSNIGGIPYVIDNNKNGLLVPPKDPKALAEAIIKLLKNPKLAKQMGEKGYKKVKENFTWDMKSKETINIINSLLK